MICNQRLGPLENDLFGHEQTSLRNRFDSASVHDWGQERDLGPVLDPQDCCSGNNKFGQVAQNETSDSSEKILQVKHEKRRIMIIDRVDTSVVFITSCISAIIVSAYPMLQMRRKYIPGPEVHLFPHSAGTP